MMMEILLMKDRPKVSIQNSVLLSLCLTLSLGINTWSQATIDSLNSVNASSAQLYDSATTSKNHSAEASFSPAIRVRETVTQELIFPQDPKICALLSATLPGLGQLYQDRYWASTFFLGGFLLSSAVVNHMAKLQSDRSAHYDTLLSRNGNIVELKRYPNSELRISKLTDSEKGLNILAFAGVATFYIWGIIDTYKSAKEFNRQNFLEPKDGVRRLGFDVKMSAYEQALAMRYSF